MGNLNPQTICPPIHSIFQAQYRSCEDNIVVGSLTRKILLRPYSNLGKDMQLDAVGRQFEPYLYRRLRLHRWRPCGVTWDAVP